MPLMSESLIGQRLKALRASRGLTQRDASIGAGVVEKTITRAEKSGSLNIETLTKLAAFYEVSPGFILEGEGSTRAPSQPDGEPAPEARIEQVIEELRLEEHLAERLRSERWSVGLPSVETLRSFALDLRRAEQSGDKSAVLPPKKRRGGMKIDG